MRALLVLIAMCGVASAQVGSGSAPKTIPIPADADAPEVTAAASPSSVKLGARFTLFVTCVFGDGVEVNLREPVALGGSFEVSRRTSRDHVRSDGKHVREYQLEVIAWEIGDLYVPPVAVTFTAGGRAGQVATNAVPLQVLGVLGNADDPKLMRDEAPPVRLTSRDLTGALVAGAVALVVLGASAIAWRRRRRRRTVVQLVAGATAAPRKIDMTSQRALQRLLAIEDSGVLERDDDRKRGYAEMADVIREYLGARYRITTLDLTTAELLRALARVASADDCARVAAWLERCDLVKYGGLRASRLEAGEVLADARALVVATVEPAREAA